MEKRTKEILNQISNVYPNPKCELNFSSPYELLVSTILSAQCTDKRVNIVTKKLFTLANTPKQMLELGEKELAVQIFSCGFYKTKAASIISSSFDILTKFDGQVPSDIQNLLTLKGVGRKTANVVFSNAFNGQAIAVDTHVYRVSHRLGLATAKGVLQTEEQLMQAIDKQLWSKAHHLLILHGRYTCKSQNQLCSQCVVEKLCEYKDKRTKQESKNV